MVVPETEVIREDHAHLREHIEHMPIVARELPDMSLQERQEVITRIVDFLRSTLLPHADEEERSLYLDVARKLGHPEATAPMTHDHVAIRVRTLELAATDETDVDQLQELLYGLYALISVHFWKEEQLYLPLIERAVLPVFDG